MQRRNYANSLRHLSSGLHHRERKFIGKIEIYWLKKCIGGQRFRKVMKAGTKERDVVQLPVHKRGIGKPERNREVM